MSKLYSSLGRIKTAVFICSAILLFQNDTFSQQGLKAEYFDGTNFEKLVTVKYERNINLSWNEIPPVEGIDPHECSIRWTGKLKPGKTGTYTFSAQVDDGIRVWIDHQLIIDQWDLNDLGLFKGTKDLIANKEYDLKVEYFNGMIEGEVRLLWKKHKEELSWYERLFGDGIEFSVISAENFIPPKEPIKIKKDVVVETKKKIKKTKTKKKPVVTPVKKEIITKAPEPKVEEPAPPRPIVSAKVAEKFIPKNVQFEKGKTIIVESSFKELNSFIHFMIRHPHLKVKIEGHTDVIGDADMNLQLSKDRAAKITEYLIEKGISSNRIQAEGFGGTRPLMVPEKGKYHPANRRVVFIIEGLETTASNR